MGVVATAGTPAAGLLSAAPRRRTRIPLLRILQLVRTVPATVPFRLAAEKPVLEFADLTARRFEFLRKFRFSFHRPGVHRLPIARFLLQLGILAAQFRVFLTQFSYLVAQAPDGLLQNRQSPPQTVCGPPRELREGRTCRNIGNQHAIHDLRAIPEKAQSGQDEFPGRHVHLANWGK